MPGARCTHSLVCSVLVAHESSPQVTGITRHSRTRMVLTAYSALPGDEFVLSPSSAN